MSNTQQSSQSVRRLPSRFQIDDKVELNFNDAGQINNCEIIKVHFSESKVLYDVEIAFHVEKEEFSTRLYNVDSCFVNPAVKKKESV